MTRRDQAATAFLLAVALIPWRWPAPLGFISERAGAADLFVLVALLLLIRAGWRTISTQITVAHMALAAFMASALVATFATTDRATSSRDLLVILELVTLALLAWEFGREYRRWLGYAALAGVATSALAALVGLGLFYAGLDNPFLDSYGALQPSPDYARVRGGFFSAPLLGSFTIVAWGVITWCKATLGSRLTLLGQSLSVALAVVSISRGLIGLLVAIATYLIWRRRPRFAPVPFIAGACAAILLTLGFLTFTPSRPVSTTYAFGENNRRYEARVALEKIPERPLTGYGPGVLTGEGLATGLPRKPHMTAINVASTLGIPALIALTVILAAAWSGRTRDGLPLWAAAAGLAVDSIGQDVDHFRHSWLLLGLLLAAAIVQQPDRVAKPDEITEDARIAADA